MNSRALRGCHLRGRAYSCGQRMASVREKQAGVGAKRTSWVRIYGSTTDFPQIQWLKTTRICYNPVSGGWESRHSLAGGLCSRLLQSAARFQQESQAPEVWGLASRLTQWVLAGLSSSLQRAAPWGNSQHGSRLSSKRAGEGRHDRCHSICNLTSEVTSHHFCWIVCIRNKSLSPPRT